MGSIVNLIKLISTSNDLRIAQASLVCLFIFIDTIYTSHNIENSGKNKYKIGLKFIDLICFLLFTLIILMLEPSNTFFGNGFSTTIDAITKKSQCFTIDNMFFALLGLYLLLTLIWNIVLHNSYSKIEKMNRYYYIIGTIVFMALAFFPDTFNPILNYVILTIELIIVIFVIYDLRIRNDNIDVEDEIAISVCLRNPNLPELANLKAKVTTSCNTRTIENLEMGHSRNILLKNICSYIKIELYKD